MKPLVILYLAIGFFIGSAWIARAEDEDYPYNEASFTAFIIVLFWPLYLLKKAYDQIRC